MSMRQVFCFSAAVILLGATSVVAANAPELINYQGILLDSGGDPVTDPVTVIFAIWDAAADGDSLWSEQQSVTPDAKGRVTILLGSDSPIPDSAFAGSDVYLSIKVESDPEMIPRQRLTSVAFSYVAGRAQTADVADSTDAITDGGVDFADIGQNGAADGQIMKMSSGNWVAANDESGGSGGSNWSVVDSVLQTNNYVGIARGGIAGNVFYGDSAHTMVNLGVACTTGFDGLDLHYITVSGGKGHRANRQYATIAGGERNTAGANCFVGSGLNNRSNGNYCVVGGGESNTASSNYCVVAGGKNNMASGLVTTVAGGFSNSVTGDYSTIPGGGFNATQGNYSFAAGRRAKANHDGTFIWADPTDADFASTNTNQFLIRSGGGVGIGTNSPAAQLDVNGTVKMTGFNLPTSPTDGYVLTSDASGVGTWQAAPAESKWTVVDSVLYTNSYWGLARGGAAGNVMYGDSLHTMINFGVACTTGQNGFNIVYSTVGGGEGNSAWHEHATVSGGRRNQAGNQHATVGGGNINIAIGASSTIAGGNTNMASGVASVVGGGHDNEATNWSATIAGGESNVASTEGSTIGGGGQNRATGKYSVVSGGGAFNISGSNLASGENSAIGGGYNNTAGGRYSTIPGGIYNLALGDYSFAVGRRAKANHHGAFVWADDTEADFASTNTDQFLIRASGGVGIGTNSPATQLDVNGTVKMTGFDLPTSATDGYVLTSDASGVGTWQAVPSAGGSNWSVVDSVLYTNSYWGIARGGIAGNVMYGDSLHTMINFGAACTTGQSGISNIVYSTVGGGLGNSARQGYTTVSGGRNNIADFNYATVGGGRNNWASNYFSVVSGGQDNRAGNWHATVGGGNFNTASGSGSTVPGGDNCTAAGGYSFAAGKRAKANHNGAFVWGDSYDGDVASSAVNQFIARASGGVSFYSNTALTTGVTLGAGGGAWSSISDRNLKDNVVPIDAQEVLAKVAELPLSTWNYKSQDEAIRHMGPMAQDVYAAFNLGADEKRINTIDADGVALAAIQGLYQQNQEQQKEIAELKALVKKLLEDKE